MRLIGVLTGVYEGNMFAKLIFTEPFTRANCYGDNAVLSKANYNYVATHIVPQVDLYMGKEVIVSYDRFGRVTEVRLDTLYHDNADNADY